MSDTTSSVAPIKSFDQFKEIINTAQVVVIDFWAEWCGPCRMMSPMFKKIAGEYKEVEFYDVDVDDQTEISEYVGVQTLPMFVVYKNGGPIETLLGAHRDKLQTLVQRHAGGDP